jgi:hypothetical protein
MNAAKATGTNPRGRKPAAKPIATNNGNGEAIHPAIIEASLKAIEKTVEEKHLAVSTQTMVSAITNAAISSKYALQLELATGLVLFAEADGISRDSKQALQKIYVLAGYDAEDQYKSDYKTVRRRIDVAAELFNWIGQNKLAELIENRAEMAAITALVQFLEQYNFKGINSVLALVGKPVKQPRKAPAEKSTGTPAQVVAEAKPAEAPQAITEEKPAEKPSETTVEDAGPVAEAVAAEIEKSRAARGGRRKNDVPGTLNFSTEHVQVIVQPNASKAEITGIVMQLLEFVNTINVGEEMSVLEPEAA